MARRLRIRARRRCGGLSLPAAWRRHRSHAGADHESRSRPSARCRRAGWSPAAAPGPGTASSSPGRSAMPRSVSRCGKTRTRRPAGGSIGRARSPALRYALPQPRSALAAALREHATAAMDVSDGLAGDLAKLCRASGVAATIEAARVPLSGAARQALAVEPSLIETILAGGDDYEIIATMPAAKGRAIPACGSSGRHRGLRYRRNRSRRGGRASWPRRAAAGAWPALVQSFLTRARRSSPVLHQRLKRGNRSLPRFRSRACRRWPNRSLQRPSMTGSRGAMRWCWPRHRRSPAPTAPSSWQPAASSAPCLRPTRGWQRCR